MRLLVLLSHLLPVTLLALLAGTATAGADVFGPVSLVSQNTTQQAIYAHDPAISGNGRYVAFDGFFGGETGVFRRDLASGAVEPVAAGEEGTPAGSAELPSISADGRYVSFTTTAALTPEDTNEAPDVYVRDMEPGLGEPQYTLASAVNGSAQGLTYEPPGPHYGSIASGRSALSANGKEVVFVTTAISNLAGPNTPALQVAVRNLETRETQLVSAEYDQATGQEIANKPVSGEEGANTVGAVYIPGTVPPPFPFATRAYKMTPAVGASISADGSTVAWMGQDIAKQAKVLPGETLPPSYTEPLWRRFAGGPQAPTRRITGGADPANPACIASGEAAPDGSSSDPCQGPFKTEALGVWIGGTGDPVPQLSADGSTVAFLAGVPPIGGNFGEDVLNRNSDLYVADMHSAPTLLTRRQALRPLTELASGNAQERATTGPIVDLAISPDGTQVAFTTQRTQFPLGSPAYVSPPAAVPGLLELFDVDLADDTLTRVSHGFEGGASEAPHREVGAERDPYGAEAGALSPSFSQAGDILAFSSTAANLVYGDGNTPENGENSIEFDGSDAFTVPRLLFSPLPTPEEVSSAPANPALTPAWELGVTALSGRDGSVQLDVEVPGAGKLSARAQAAVPIRYRLPLHSVRRAAGRRHLVSTTVATRAVAAAKKATSASTGVLATLTLKLAPAYSALAWARGGLSATVNLVFTSPGHPALRQGIDVTFVRSAKPHPAKHRGTKKKARGKR